MAIVTSFIFSEDTKQITNQNGQGSGLNVINPQNVFRPMFIPGTFSFSLTFGIVDMDPEKSHVLRFLLVHSDEPDIAIIDTRDINIPINSAFDKLLPKEANGVMFNLDFRNVPFKKPGKYIGIIKANNETIEEKILFIFPQESL